MGTLTLTDLKVELRAALGNRTDLDSRLTKFLNLSQDRISRIRDFEEMRQNTTVSHTYTGTDSDGEYNLADMRTLHTVRVIDGYQSRKLKYKTMRWIDTHVPDPAVIARGTPTIYSRWQNTIYFYPWPDKTYSIKLRWTKWPTAFTDSLPNATSDLDRKDDAILELAVAYVMYSLGKDEEAAKRESRGLRLVREAVNEDWDEPDIHIAPTPGTEGETLIGPPDYLDPFVRGR